jgi:hypothetical protein
LPPRPATLKKNLYKKTQDKSGSQYCLEELSLGLPGYLGSFSTDYIIFRNAEIFQKKNIISERSFFFEKKLRIF